MQISRGIIQGAQKVVIYGPEGIGKSYFASKFPNPVFIDTEGSTKHMDVARTPKPSSWTMLLEQVKYFKANPTACDTLIVDTADWAEQLCTEHLVALAPNAKEHGLGGIEGFGYGKGYTYLAEEFGRLLNSLSDIIDVGIHVVLVAHAWMRKFEQPDEVGSYDRWELKLQKKTAPLIKEWADMILFANYETYVVNIDGKGALKGKNKAQGDRRIMYTTHHNCWDAKNRHDLLDKLPLDYDEIRHCIPVRDVKPVEIQPSEPPKDVTQAFELMVDKKVDTPPHNPLEVFADIAKEVRIDDTPQPRRQNNPFPGLPKPLVDLMLGNGVNDAEIRRAVASRGYYPEDTPITKYDPAFVQGVLIGAWPQLLEMIKELETVPY